MAGTVRNGNPERLPNGQGILHLPRLRWPPVFSVINSVWDHSAANQDTALQSLLYGTNIPDCRLAESPDSPTLACEIQMVMASIVS
jgi:hypothetical protein